MVEPVKDLFAVAEPEVEVTKLVTETYEPEEDD